jgi:RimJ/RimL family protein N-acetyltransferase
VPFLPREHPIPPGFDGPGFKARPITIHDAVRDYDAVMTSAARLRERFPLWNWPADSLSLEEDLIDLAWHQKEAELRRSFNYVVLAPDESRVLGCVYVDPPEKQGADAEVTLWVRAEAEGTGLEEELESAARDWLASEWPFDRVRWPGREISWEEWDRLPDA